MSFSQDHHEAGLFAANDNQPGAMQVEVRLPRAMPVQIIEIEVLAELLESLAFPANDNEVEGQ